MALGCGLLGLVAIGCGSSDDTIAKADKLCKTSQEKQLKLLDGTSSTSKDPKVMKQYLDSSFTQTKELNDQLRDLAPPTDKEKQWKAWMASLEEQEKAEDQLIETVKPGMTAEENSPYLNALNEAISQQVKRNKLATELGLETCGQNASI